MANYFKDGEIYDGFFEGREPGQLTPEDESPQSTPPPVSIIQDEPTTVTSKLQRLQNLKLQSLAQVAQATELSSQSLPLSPSGFNGAILDHSISTQDKQEEICSSHAESPFNFLTEEFGDFTKSLFRWRMVPYAHPNGIPPTN